MIFNGLVFFLLGISSTFAATLNSNTSTIQTHEILKNNYPVYLATKKSNAFDVNYKLLQGAAGQEPKQYSLQDDIVKFVNPPTSILYTLNEMKVYMQIYQDGTYSVQYISGPKLDLTDREIVDEYVQQIKSRQFRQLPPVPATLYPEILVVVHYNLFKLFGGDVNKTINYVIEFWTRVDLRFRVLEQPMVRLNVAGIVIAENEESTPYSQETPTESNFWQLALNETAKYFYKLDAIPKNYDIVIIMHKISLEDYDGKPGIEGSAFTESACKKPLTANGKIFNAVGMIGDDANFQGIRAAAHEIAHIFGAVHDHNEFSSLLGTWCPRFPNVAFIMTYQQPGDRIIDEFSHCSVRAMNTFLNSEYSKCLFDKPLVRSIAKRPIKKLTYLEQCQMKHGKNMIVEYTKEHPCHAIICRSVSIMKHSIFNYYYHSDSKSYYLHPIDGTTCGQGRICLQMKCVPELEEGY